MVSAPWALNSYAALAAIVSTGFAHAFDRSITPSARYLQDRHQLSMIA
jgi:hypothetical protein